eukprot:CAMPEP_0183377064 /NCGR_PEP_ID=MMETSP0164_2-20130417/122036_1 /TAXON_ID=221442 /ORGANISM="Coccolithus pelagicus ssp braarudi, Strain PLY182g" /LENGTH=144 /DNA_ID=CAMNT_0025554477 /DNA_START=35 /DNA_END=470 /DNA_ORIENTATION=+
MPHYKDPWCSGVDFLYDIDYRDLLEREIDPQADVQHVSASTLRSAFAAVEGDAPLNVGNPETAFTQRVVLLEAVRGQLEWLPMDGFKRTAWTGAFPTKVEAMLQATAPAGPGLGRAQLQIVKDCLQSLMKAEIELRPPVFGNAV